MSAMQGDTAPPRPDPSAHPQGSTDSANKAAVLATKPAKGSSTSREIDALGPDGKLSAAGAATSLKYANAKDLPSFPTVGIDSATSGNKAANLANSNQKPIELWKPDPSSSASRAALLASRDGGKVDLWQYSPDGTGNTAATAAMGKNTSPQLDYGYTADGRKKALQAATMSLAPRERPTSSESAPPTELYPDQFNAGFNALNAATVAGRPSTRLTGADAARVQNIHMSREMFTERPPVALEVEEKKRKEVLRASAVSMAQQLYNLERADTQRSTQSPGSLTADRVAGQSYEAATTNLSGDALRVQAMNYGKVQEEAQRLATERLAKLNLDPEGIMAYREHYGYGQSPPKSRFSSGGQRPKSGSGHQTRRSRDLDSDDDEAQAAKIKSQMSRFNDQVATVDAKKRTQDREALMAAAERIVHARMQNMDEKVFAETGRIPPSMMEDWETKARAKATAESEQRMVNHGKVHIGGGKFMDQSEVDAIAAARMQPTLDEINVEAERRRAHEEAVRLDLEQHKQRVEEEKQRDRAEKAEQKRISDEANEKRRQERAVEKANLKEIKDKEREALKAEKMQLDLEKRMSKMEERHLKEKDKADKAWKVEQQRMEDERIRKANQKEAEDRALAIKEAAAVSASKEAEVQTETTKEDAVPVSDVETKEDYQDYIKRVYGPSKTTKEETAQVSVPETKEETTLQEESESQQTSSNAVDVVGFLQGKGTVESEGPKEPEISTTTETATRDVPSAITIPARDDPLVSAANDEPESPTTVVAATETSPTPRRDSRVKSIFGKIKRFSKSVPATASDQTAADKTAQPTESEDTSKIKQVVKTIPATVSNEEAAEKAAEKETAPTKEETVPEPEAVTTEPEVEAKAIEPTETTVLSDNAKGKQPASLKSVSSVDDDQDSRGRNMTDTSTADVFEEARDTFDSEPEGPRENYSSQDPITGSPARTGSKFQEEL